MNNSVILQVDESTKGLMEEIQSGISSSIEEGIRDVKDKIVSVDGNTDMILRKFRNFDGLSSTIDQLRTLAQDSKKFAEMVSPIQASINEIQKESESNEQILSEQTNRISLLVKGVVELNENQKNFSSSLKEELKTLFETLSGHDGQIKQTLKEISTCLLQFEEKNNQFASEIISHLTEMNKALETVCHGVAENRDRFGKAFDELFCFLKKFETKYDSKESSHSHFEDKTSQQIQSINESLEKIQATQDIIVNLVTPFWKKWTK